MFINQLKKKSKTILFLIKYALFFILKEKEKSILVWKSHKKCKLKSMEYISQKITNADFFSSSSTRRNQMKPVCL